MIYSLESNLSLKTKIEVEDELLFATKWISEELKIDYEKTRLGQYIKYLQGKEKLDSIADFQLYLMTAREIDDLLRVFQAFIDDQQPTLKKKIETAISGQAFRYSSVHEERDESRDYLHELAVASRFKSSGLVVDITGECDVVVEYKSKKIFIECKRIKSKIQLYKRFKKAEKQLAQRIGINKKNKIGFIALDITDLVNTDDKVYEFSSVSHLNNFFYTRLNDFVSQHKVKMRGYVSRETKSVLFFVNGFGSVRDKSGTSVINTTVIHALGCESNPRDEKLNDKILRGII